jgi:protein-L-isoaspartate(D-aspartate) O-methyltransferase
MNTRTVPATLVSLALGCVLALTGCSRAPAAPPAATPAVTPAATAISEGETPGAAPTAQDGMPAVPTASPTRIGTTPTEEPAFAQAREAMVVQQIERRGVSNPAVLHAMRAVARHRFVPEDYVGQAYNDHPLPIGYGQTISQPYIVAWMTELLELESDYRVLEIGTGSGYQAAVLAEIVDEVYTIEIVPELEESARIRLQELGYENIQVLRADGYWGWLEHAPFDAIIVTAAPDHVPLALAQQLEEGAHLVIPIGPPGGYQSLWQFTHADGELSAREISGVRFVPFTREE